MKRKIEQEFRATDLTVQLIKLFEDEEDWINNYIITIKEEGKEEQTIELGRMNKKMANFLFREIWWERFVKSLIKNENFNLL